MNYYPHHIGDYLRDTAHLTALEDGIYRRMLDLYYASEKPLPLNIEGLCRLVRAKSKCERDAVDTILEEFFKREIDGWRNKRADEEIEKGASRIGNARQNGRLGGRPKTQPEPSGLSLGSGNITQLKAPQNQKPKPKAKTKETTKALAFAPPEWVPAKAWEDWLEVRKKKRAPNTDSALELAVVELEKLRSAGHDPLAVLQQSVFRGWQGLFELRGSGSVPDYSAVIAAIKE